MRSAGTKRPCAVASQVAAGTRELVSSTVSGAVGLARGGVERTRSALSTGVGAVVGSRVGRLLATGVDVVLGKSEELVERYLPGTDEQPGECRLRRARNRLPNLGVPSPSRCPHPVAEPRFPCVAPQVDAWAALQCQGISEPHVVSGATTAPRRGPSPPVGDPKPGNVMGELSPGNQKANIAQCRLPGYL